MTFSNIIRNPSHGDSKCLDDCAKWHKHIIILKGLGWSTVKGNKSTE